MWIHIPDELHLVTVVVLTGVVAMEHPLVDQVCTVIDVRLRTTFLT